MTGRATFVISSLIALVVMTAQVHSAESAYPQRPIRLLIGQSPGGTSDTVGRTLAQRIGEYVGQPIVIDNRAGAGGLIANDIVARALPDGYTMLLSGPNLVIGPVLAGKITYDPLKEFAPIIRLAEAPNVWLVHPSHPARSMMELVAFAKERPGQVDFASAGTGTTQHLAGELLNLATGIRLSHIPYKGGGPALLDLLGARVLVMSSTLPSAVGSIKSGKVRALAVTSAQRSPVLPDVPTVAESAALPTYEVVTWQGFLFPVRASAVAIERIQRETARALGSPDIVARLRDLGLEPVGGTTAHFTRYLEVERDKWTRVITSAGLKSN